MVEKNGTPIILSAIKMNKKYIYCIFKFPRVNPFKDFILKDLCTGVGWFLSLSCVLLQSGRPRGQVQLKS